jgi:adenylate kinase
MMVEFVGAAGVGKTYLSGRVLETLRERGFAARDFTLIDKRRAGAHSLVLLAKAVGLAVRMRLRTPSAFRRSVEVIWKYTLRREVGRQLDGIQVTSEGLFHKIISFYRKSDGLDMNELADILFREIEPPDAVIVLEADPDIVFARRSARNRPNDRFSRESVRDDIAAVRRTVGAMEHIRATRNPAMQVLRIPLEEDGGDNAVATIIAALGSSTGAAPALAAARS